MTEVKEVKKRNKHNYTCELELKALIIMINNSMYQINYFLQL